MLGHGAQLGSHGGTYGCRIRTVLQCDRCFVNVRDALESRHASLVVVGQLAARDRTGVERRLCGSGRVARRWRAVDLLVVHVGLEIVRLAVEVLDVVGHLRTYCPGDRRLKRRLGMVGSTTALPAPSYTCAMTSRTSALSKATP